MQVMSNTVGSPNGTGPKSRKYVGHGCSPSPSSVKQNNLPVILVDGYAND